MGEGDSMGPLTPEMKRLAVQRQADIKYPTDAGLASSGVRTLAREGRKLAVLVGEQRRRVRDRSRAIGTRLRSITRTIRRRTGEAKAEVLKLTGETGELLSRSVKEARQLAAVARRRARGRGARTKLKAAATLEQLADRCEKVAQQITKRVAGELMHAHDAWPSATDDARAFEPAPHRSRQARQVLGAKHLVASNADVVTSLSRETGQSVEVSAVTDLTIRIFSDVFDRKPEAAARS